MCDFEAIGLVLAAALLPLGAAASEPVEGAKFSELVVPFFQSYCTGCHGKERQKAELDLESFTSAASVQGDRQAFERVVHMLRDREMPPEGKKQPPEADRIAVTELLQAFLDDYDCSQAVDPGRVTLRRLNRVEYDNSIRDLFGVDLQLSRDFPADEIGHGFDNIGDVLSLPPLLLEKYLAAAEAVADRVIGPTPPRFQARIEAETISGVENTQRQSNWALSLTRETAIGADFDAPSAGWYRLRARAYGEQAGGEPPRLEFRLDGVARGEVSVAAVEESPRIYDVAVRLDAGRHRLDVAYTNNYVNLDDPDPARRGDRNLVIDWFEAHLVLPDAPSAAGKGYDLILGGVRGTDAAGGGAPGLEALRPRLERLATLAQRRPAAADEVDRLAALADGALEDGESLEGAAHLVLQAVLTSPRFLFRFEFGSETAATEGGEPTTDARVVVRQLDGYELASRLSYFLWSTTPDERLLDLAAAGALDDDAVLAAEVARLLRDPRSRELVDNFAGQWLQTRFLKMVTPDPGVYPDFDEDLRRAMEREVLEFFGAIVAEDRSILELIDADFTFINERLARHYGIEGITGDEFRRVPLAGSSRGGILTMASFLTITSNPTRTSPVKRGLWVLDRVLGTPPPPPPPDVPELEEGKEAVLAGSLRARMEKHRENATCASCHSRMDPIGFAFENFDGIGRWREFDGQFLIDPSGTLPGGQAFAGPDGLKELLIAKKGLFLRTAAEKMLVYALGRGLENYDRCAVDGIVRALETGEYRFSALVLGVVRSHPFRFTRGGGT